MARRTVVIPLADSHGFHFGSFSSSLFSFSPTHPPVHLPPIHLSRWQTVCPVTPTASCGSPENKFLYSHSVSIAAKKFMSRQYLQLTHKSFSHCVDRVKRVLYGTNGLHLQQQEQERWTPPLLCSGRPAPCLAAPGPQSSVIFRDLTFLWAYSQLSCGMSLI